MKIKLSFDDNTRSFTLIPEDPLEECLLKDMAERNEKGSQIAIKQILHVANSVENDGYRVEMKVNGA